jgi:hypothetical protein
MPTPSAKKLLEAAFWNAWRECKLLKPPYGPSRFAQMLNERGAVGTAIELIMRSEPTSGFLNLWDRSPRRLDLTVEAIVVKGWVTWSQLFKEVPALYGKAVARLQAHGYSVRT